MNPYQNILLATDFSRHAELSAARAQDIASRYNARLQVLHVVEEVVLYTEDTDMMMGNPFLENEALLGLAQDRLKNFAQLAGFSDEVSLEVQWGNPKSSIISYASDHKIDLIIMGSHGHHGIKMLLGSVSNGVVHHAPCDTLLVRK